MPYMLSPNEKAQIQTLKNNGDYDVAYRYIADRINSAVQSGDVASSTQRWFQWAAEINGNTGSLINSYARTFTKMGASADGITITDADFQDASDKIAIAVLNEVISNGKIPTTPENIILQDIATGSQELGIDNEDFAGTLIGGMLFDTPTLDALILNDPTNAGIWNKVQAFSEQLEKHALIGGSIVVVGPIDLITDGFAHIYALMASALEGALDSIKNALHSAIRFNDPLIVDMDGDGVELVSLHSAGAVFWDHAGDGYAEASGWVGANDALLTLDKNQDGVINNGTELFGDQTGKLNGFQDLARYDSNNDGKITAENQVWSKMRLWQDTNGNAYSESSELHTLDEMGVTQINLNYSNVNQNNQDNRILQQSSATINGIQHIVADAALKTNATNSVFDLEYTFDDRAFFLPTQRGYGKLASLHAAISMGGIVRKLTTYHY